VVYEQTGVPASEESDIDLPTNTPADPLVQFATGASWKAIASTYAQLSDPQTLPAETQSILPANLPADRDQRIAAIVARLHKEVRYTGVEFDQAQLTPQRPSVVLKRHYGDCKDKATLLVAMLRAENIPANLALLSTGAGLDVEAELPGMNEFDHAIVYVPATADAKALWIDATAEYFQPGSLPYMDQGRMALIIAPETASLTRIPDPVASDSHLVETRTFTLAPFGPSKVVELSETSGRFDGEYREEYATAEAGKTRTNLEDYIRRTYNGKALSKVTHGEAADLMHPFNLTLDIDGARRGFTDLSESIVALYPSSVLDNLPRWFSKAPPVVDADTSADTRHDLEVAQKARESSYAIEPFLEDRRIRIVIPDGFTLRSLPPAKTITLGTATLTETYAANDPKDPGVVTATFHFDTGPGTLTAEQALAMRTAVVEFNKSDYVGVYFDQAGAKALAEGHIRAALDADRALIAAHPAEALQHVRLARVFLEAGIGDAAHAEARKATELDPKSSTAFNTLGWTLQHNDLGVRFGKGYDLAGSVAAYKKAIALDPEDNDAPYDLAILSEFDVRGIRYADDADMAGAIKLYRELIERTKDSNPAAAAQYKDNLLYALIYTRQFAELDKLLAATPSSSAHSALAIASATIQHGTQAGITQSDQGNAAATDRKANLRAAGGILANLRMYPEASALLSAGMGGSDAPTVARQVEMYRNLHPVDMKPLPATNPATPVQSLTFGLMAGTLGRGSVAATLAHHAYSSAAALQRTVDKELESADLVRVISAKTGISESVLIDLIGGSMTFDSSGDDATGHPLTATTPGSAPSHFFVVREDGVYRIVAEGNDNPEGNVPVGNQVLYSLEHNNAAQAKALLDWKRELDHKGGGDDPFSGSLLPRFWTIGSTKPDADSPAAMRLAAISLLAGSMDAKPYLAEIAAARDKATGARQTDLDILLAVAAADAEQPSYSLPAALRLLDQEPDSATALEFAGKSYALENDSAAWLAMLAPRLAKKPKDRDLLAQQARAYELTHNYTAARAALQTVLDSGKATASDNNSFAWLGLFDNHVGDPELKAAQQSTMLSKNASFSDLHTLACIYAALGRTTEARQVLTEAMNAANEADPNSEVWYALGLLYEQYGATDAALTAYKKVQAHEFDDHTYIDPASTYLLAQARIAALKPPASR